MSDSACCKELCNELEDGFETPVEKIMKCEDFKSNFARRLSNRYGVRLPVTDKKEDELQKLPTELNTPEKIADVAEADDVKDTCQKDDSDSNVVGKSSTEINTSINKTEVTDLNRKVATLNWQLNQVEGNRQIHISLLKQLVIFLNRVKDHLQNQESVSNDAELPVSPRGDLPRSRSVVHVNKNPDFTLTPAKKSDSKKLSQSISNVNRFKECSNWDSSKICVTIETNTDKKIIEEMKRLIILATTLLNTKIPNLAAQSGNTSNVAEKVIPKIELTLLEPHENVNKELDLQRPNNFKSLAVPSNVNINYKKDLGDGAVASCSRTVAPPPRHPFLYGIMSSMSSLDLVPIERKIEDDDSDNKNKPTDEKVDDVNVLGDESGFSSMNSFQEIGIPIIQVIPPTPPEELVFIDDKPMTNGNGPHSPEEEAPNVFWV